MTASFHDVAQSTEQTAEVAEQGRGFAVVADEVCQLAGRTQEATVEITEVIQSPTVEVNESFAQMDHARVCSSDANGHSEATRRAIKAINQAIADMTERCNKSLQRVPSKVPWRTKSIRMFFILPSRQRLLRSRPPRIARQVRCWNA